MTDTDIPVMLDVSGQNRSVPHCTHRECPKPHYARGLCVYHYRKARYHTDAAYRQRVRDRQNNLARRKRAARRESQS